MERPSRVLLVFLDGVGIGPADPMRNPFATAEMPNLRERLEGARLVLDEIGATGIEIQQGGVRPIDATMGIRGLPQSGTGQTALLTGVNTAERLGRHFGPWVPTGLRELLAGESLLQRGSARGLNVAFANAYPAGHMQSGGAGNRRPGAWPYAADRAGKLVRNEASVRRGEALPSSITTGSWRKYVDPAAPDLDPEAAGHLLARIAADADLTLFAHFETDYIGHRGDLDSARALLARVDAFLGAVLERLPPDALLLVTSDHGNLEEMGTGHTRNAIPLLALGAGALTALRRVASITDVAPSILEILEPRR